MPIDFSKINLSVLPRGGNVVKTSAVKRTVKGGRIDYGAIKLSNIYTPARVAPKPAAIPKNAGKSAPIAFQGRPLVTPVEQQRMKAATPKPTSPASLWLTGKTVEQRIQEGKQALAAYGGKSFFDALKEGVDTYNNVTAKAFMGQNAPAEGGITGNRYVDFAASLATMGAAIKIGVQVVGGLVSAINFTREMNSKWNWPTVEGGVASNDLAVRVAQANPNMDKGTANSIASLVARTGGNAAQLNALVSNTSMLSRSLDKIAIAAQNPSTALNIIPSAVQNIAQTGIFQSIPMPAGLVHSTVPAIPMGGKTQPVVQAPIEEPRVATEPYVSRDKFQVEHPLLERPQPAVPGVKTTKSYADIMAKEEEMGAKLNATPRAVDKTIPAIDVKKANLVDVTAKVDLQSVQVKFPSADKVVVDTKRRVVMFMRGTTPLEAIAVDKPQLKDWYGIEGAKLLGEITQPVQAQSVAEQLKTLSSPTSIAESFRQAGESVAAHRAEYRAKTNTLPDGTIIAGWKKETLAGDVLWSRGNKHVADVIVEVGQKAVDVALATQPAPVVAQVAPTLSKMETPAAVKEPWVAADEVIKPYVDGLGNLSDKQLKAEEKQVAAQLTKFADNIPMILPSGKLNPALLGTQAYFEISHKFAAINDEIDARKAKAIQPSPLRAPKELQPLVAEAKKYPSAEAFVAAMENPTNLTAKNLPIGEKNFPVGGWLIDTVLDRQGGKMYRIKMPDGKTTVIPVDQTKVITGWGNGLADFYDTFVGKAASVSPSLSTTPQKGTATTISNQKTGLSTSPAVSPQGEAKTGASAVKWGKWKKAGSTDYRLVNELTQVRQWGKSDFQPPTFGKLLQFKGDPHSYYLMRDSAVPASKGFPSVPASYRIIEARSGNSLVPSEPTVDGVVSAARKSLDKYNDTDDRISELVGIHGGEANPTSVPSALITSTSAPTASPSLGNATPAHGLIDYSRIELNGTTSQTSPSVLSSVGNAGKRSRVETKGFDNYIQNTTGTKDTSLSLFAEFKEGRDLQVRRYENQFDGLMKTPAGAEWMTLAIEADEVLREEYARPFSINEAGERVYAEGEFAPAILNRYLKQYGPNFGKFLQHLQRAGISTETTLGLSAEKEALKQKHIYDARMSLANFQKNEPQLFTAYMAAADELGNANTLLAEFYKGMISPETYANDKANPHYYVSLSAGKTDVFDRSGVAPLEKTHGLTDLDHVVPPLEGLKAVYVDAIRAQGIHNAKWEAVKSSPNSEVATTELSDSIVHLNENGKDRAFDVHDTNVTQSVKNLTLKKPEVPTWEKWLVKAPTTALRLFATGLNPAFGLFNIMRDTIQSIGTVPFTPTGLVKGTIRAFKSPGLSQWFDSYRDPMMSKGARATETIKKIVEIVTFPNEIGESLLRSITAETIINRGGTYLDQLHGYYASTGFFALHGTFFNDFLPSCIPFTRATIAVVRSAYRNTFLGLPIGGKGGTFSGKQGAEKLAGRNLATIIFTVISALAVKEAGKEKEYKLLRDRASYFYFPTPSGAWVKLPVPIGFQPIKAVVDSLFGYKSDPLGVAGQTLNVLPGLESFMLPPALALFLQYKFNINFFTGAAITAAVGTPAANPLEAALMKTGMDEGQAAFLVRAFLADIPSQVQYVFDMVGQGSSTQAFPASKRFIVKDPTTSSNAAVDDFYALVDAAGRSGNPALKHYVNARADAIGKLLHNAKAYPAEAKVYMTTATDNIIATFATIAENPSDYAIKKYGPFSWRPSGNYEELAP